MSAGFKFPRPWPGFVGSWREGVELITSTTNLSRSCSAAIAEAAGFGPFLALRPSSLGKIAGLCPSHWNSPAYREVPETLRRWSGGGWFRGMLKKYPGLVKSEDDAVQGEITKLGWTEWVEAEIEFASSQYNVDKELKRIQAEMIKKLQATPPYPVWRYVEKHIYMRRGKKFENKTLDRYEKKTGIKITDRNTGVFTYQWDGLIDGDVLQIQLRGQLDGRQPSTGRIIELKNRVRRTYEPDVEKAQCLSYLMMFDAQEVIHLQALWFDKGKHACKLLETPHERDDRWWRMKVEEKVAIFVRNVAYIVLHEEIAVQFLSPDTGDHERLWKEVTDLAWDAK